MNRRWRRQVRSQLLIPLGLFLAHCADVRDIEPSQIQRYPASTFSSDIQALLTSRCSECHSAPTPAGQYNLTDWRGILGPGSDGVTRNAIAGRPDSLLLTKLTGDDELHATLLTSAESDRLRAWVIDDRLAYMPTDYHPADWVYPLQRNSLEFHGGALRARGWDTADCETCHGADLRGGPTGKSCFACHEKGIDDCGTCHGASDTLLPIPDLSWALDPQRARGVGAHAAHAGTSLFSPIPCRSCHRMPASVDEPGHLFDRGAESDLRAEIILANDPRAAFDGVAFNYDPETGTCTVYCHGPSLEEGRSGPTWTGTGACDSCHTVPMANFGGPDCSVCHQQSTEPCEPETDDPACLPTGNGFRVRFRRISLHGDGRAPLGRAGQEGTCFGCHGSEESGGAPAPDLYGRAEQTRISVGLHELHLTGNRFRAPLPCASCHRVPQALTEEGHIDDDLPAEVVFSELADGRLRDPAVERSAQWNREAATCSNTHCHSLGGGTVEQWRWTRRASEDLDCTSCHGMPPRRMVNGSIHTLTTDCSRSGCHNAAYRDDGELDTTKHINGIVEVGP
jgi:predicted CxxxxCH...CXXCH cytochrome family protein